HLLVVVRGRDLLGRADRPEDLAADLVPRRVVVAVLPRRLSLRALLDGLLARVGKREDSLAVDLLALDQPLVLEQLQGRLDRAGPRAPAAPGALLELLDHLVAVHRAPAQQGEDREAHVAPPGTVAARAEAGPPAAPHLASPPSPAAGVSRSVHRWCPFRL